MNTVYVVTVDLYFLFLRGFHTVITVHGGIESANREIYSCIIYGRYGSGFRWRDKLYLKTPGEIVTRKWGGIFRLKYSIREMSVRD